MDSFHKVLQFPTETLFSCQNFFILFIAVYCQVAALLSTKSGQFQLKMAGRAYASRFLPALSSCNTQNYCQRMHRIFQSGHQWVKVKCSKGVTHISIFITKQASQWIMNLQQCYLSLYYTINSLCKHCRGRKGISLRPKENRNLFRDAPGAWISEFQESFFSRWFWCVYYFYFYWIIGRVNETGRKANTALRSFIHFIAPGHFPFAPSHYLGAQSHCLSLPLHVCP